MEEDITREDLINDLIGFIGGRLNEPSQDEGWFTVKQVAARLGASTDYARKRLDDMYFNGKILRQRYKNTHYYKTDLADEKE